jgi:hypothetical protein
MVDVIIILVGEIVMVDVIMLVGEIVMVGRIS